MISKNDIIANTVSQLQNKYGKDSILIQDHWKDTNNAIGIVDREQKRLAYISAYEQDLFYLVLEQLTPDDEFPYKEVGEFDNINFKGLEEKIVHHFNLIS